MGFHELIFKHKKELEMLQWAVISGVSSLVYSEYIRCIKEKTVPSRLILLPTIKSVMDLLKPNEHFMTIFSDNFLNEIMKRISPEYLKTPELNLLHPNNHELMQEFLSLYFIPNIYKSIPDTIIRKFGLNNEDQQLFRESREIDMFKRQPISDDQMKFVYDEIALHALMMANSIEKESVTPEDLNNINLCQHQILTIDNDNAVCPIHINGSIIRNASVIELLKFVTSSIIESDLNNNEYYIQTSAFNKVTVTTIV